MESCPNDFDPTYGPCEVWKNTEMFGGVDCSTSLADAGFTNPNAIPYNSAGSSVTIFTDYTTIFTHSLTTDCPLTTCLLKEPGCGTDLGA